MVGLADLKKHLDIVKKCNMSLNDKYCYFSLSGVNTIDFLDIVNYKSWVYKTFQRTVNIRYVYIIKKLEKGNTIVRTSVGFAPLLLRFLKIKGYKIRDEDIEIFKARNIVFPDFKIRLYDFQERMINDWLAAGSIGVLKSPTGSGKTIIGCSAIKRIGRKTLILVHTSDLLINVWNDSLIKSFGPGIMGQVGIIGGGLTDRDRAALKLGVRSGDFDENVRKDIVIATFQTLMNRIDDLTRYKFGLMMVDECIPVDSEIWTQDGVVQYENLGYGQDYKRDVFQVWSRNNEDNVVNNGYKKIKTRMKNMYRTIVETGDELVCSLDHKVLTRKGDGKEDFVEIESVKNIARSLVRPYDMRKDCILARAFGYILGDGWVDVNRDSGAGGDYEGLARLQYDLKRLNYYSNIGEERELDSTIDSISSGMLEVHGTVYSIKFDKRFSELLIKLGHPLGRKPNQVYYIPNWIMNGNIAVKREFVAGYLGAESSNPGFRGSEENKLKKSFFVPRLSITKRIDLVNKGLEFADQFKKLLKDLDVDVSNIGTREGNIRKDGTISRQIIITIGNQVDNLRRYLDIGCRYCHEKEKEGEVTRLFLKYIDQCNQERDDIHDQVKKLYDKGVSRLNKIVAIMNSRSSAQKNIMSSWGIDEEDDKIINKKCLVFVTGGMVSDILYPHKRDDGTDIISKTVKLKKDMYGFDDWMKKVSGDFIFLDILRHEYRGCEQGYTLTVNSDHNYLVNGFDVSNCHHCPAQMFRKVNAVIRAPYKLGLSATIERLDGMTRDVFGQLGSVQSKVSIRELINRGILAEPRFQSPIIVDRDVIDSIQDSGLSGLNYSRLVKKKSASSQKKKDFVVNICKNIAARDRKFLLFTDYVNAEDVFVRDMYADSLLKEGTSVSVIDQGMASDERSAVFNFLEKGDISGIIFGKLGSEGVNIPSVDVVVMANAIKCVSGDTLVPTDKGIIRAEDLEVIRPNFVFTIDPDTGSAVMAKINEFYNFDEEDTIIIRTLEGYEIEGSTSHRVVTGWSSGTITYTSLSDLHIGSSVLICGNIAEKDVENNRRVIFYDKVVSKKDGRNKLYDMNIDKYHSFIAGGFVNHNSPITFTQRVGRAMRRIPGKDWCDVYEVLLDLPTEMKWSHYNFAEYSAEGFQKLVYKVE